MGGGGWAQKILSDSILLHFKITPAMWVCNLSQTTAVEHDWLWQIHFGFTRWAATQLIILVTYLNPINTLQWKGWLLTARQGSSTDHQGGLVPTSKRTCFFQLWSCYPLKTLPFLPSLCLCMSPSQRDYNSITTCIVIMIINWGTKKWMEALPWWRSG